MGSCKGSFKGPFKGIGFEGLGLYRVLKNISTSICNLGTPRHLGVHG